MKQISWLSNWVTNLNHRLQTNKKFRFSLKIKVLKRLKLVIFMSIDDHYVTINKDNMMAAIIEMTWYKVTRCSGCNTVMFKSIHTKVTIQINA